MTEIAIALSLFSILWIVTRSLQVSYFLKHFHNISELPPPEGFVPSVAVILCLRGADPVLSSCLKGLLQQDYSNYQVQIVVDHEQDPAREVVAQFLEENPPSIPVEVSILENKSPVRALKCSSILQALSKIGSDCEVVAFIDADTIAHPTWLQDLVAPLHNPEIGATSGNRWYLPTDSQWGSLVRHLWNITAVIMMQFLHMPWGGTLAIKTQALQESGLSKLWERSLVEDTPVYQALKDKGLRIEFVPSLFMVNSESCDLLSFLKWSQRQSLFSRLYHPAWLITCSHSILNLISFIPAVVALSIALYAKEWVAVAWLSFGLAVYLGGFAILAEIMDQNIRNSIIARGEQLTPASLMHRLRVIVAIPFCILVCGVTTLLTQGLRRVRWRGIAYQIQGAWGIEMVEYSPYEKNKSSADSMASL